MDKPTLGIIGFTVIVLVAIFGIGASQSSQDAKTAPRDVCVEHQGLAMHIHPVVEIFVNGEKVAIPGNIGISSSCMKAVHTHDESGTLHLEYPEKHDFVLGDFFANWGQPFSKDQLMEHKVDDTHEITVTVDGQPSTEFENLVLKDEQKVVIRYGTKQ